MSEAENKKVIVLRRTRDGLQSEIRPILIDYKKRRKKKRQASDNGEEKYSEGLEDVQRLEGTYCVSLNDRQNHSRRGWIHTKRNETVRQKRKKVEPMEPSRILSIILPKLPAPP